MVSAFDPAVRQERAELAAPGIRMTDTAEAVFDGAKAVVVATEWPESTQVDLASMRARVSRPVIFDGRGIIDPGLAVHAGFSYRGIGRAAREPAGTGLAAHGASAPAQVLPSAATSSSPD